MLNVQALLVFFFFCKLNICCVRGKGGAREAGNAKRKEIHNRKKEERNVRNISSI